MACESWRSKLDTYLDNELSSEDTRSFDTHVRSCPGCAVEALSRVQTKRRIQAAGKRFTPNAQFRGRVRESIGVRPKQSYGFAWTTATIVLALLVIVGVSYWSTQRDSADRVFGEVADLHVANLAGSSVVDVVSSDRHTVKPWFNCKVLRTYWYWYP